MMNALNRSTQIFTKLMFVNGSVFFSMSLQRLVLFLVVVRHWLFGADGLTITMSFVNGARFDLCVLGFMNLPVLVIVWVMSTDFVVNSSNKVVQFFRSWILWIYFGVTTLVIHVLGLLDMMFFAANNHRWTYYDWQESGLGFVSTVAQSWGGLFTISVVILFLMLWLFRCIFTLYKVKLDSVSLENLKHRESKAALVGTGLVLPLFITALAARGTWTAHHINIEHARVSQLQVLNQMTLSPVWAFDKKF
jgi:hypothetical protein